MNILDKNQMSSKNLEYLKKASNYLKTVEENLKLLGKNTTRNQLIRAREHIDYVYDLLKNINN